MRNVPPGARNNELNRQAYRAAKNGNGSKLLGLRGEAVEASLAADEVERTLKSATEAGKTERERREALQLDHYNFLQIFRAKHRKNRRWDPRSKRHEGWRAWTGNAWELTDIARDALAVIREQCEAYAREDPEKYETRRRQARGKWTQRHHATSVAALARMELTRRVWDADPLLLGLPGGKVADLRTGDVRAQRRSDYIIQATAVDPASDHEGEAADFLFGFLEQVTGQDETMFLSLQEAFGAALIGDNRFRRIELLVGPTATGKTTLLELAIATLGDYATAAPSALFNGRDDQHPTDAAAVVYRRLVTTAEVEGRTWRAGFLKALSGGDTISVRRLYRDPHVAHPACSVFLASNDPPTAHSVDDAMKARLRVWPFVTKPDHPGPRRAPPDADRPARAGGFPRVGD